MGNQNKNISQPSFLNKALAFVPTILGLLLIWSGIRAIVTKTALFGRGATPYQLTGDSAVMAGIISFIPAVGIITLNLFLIYLARKRRLGLQNGEVNPKINLSAKATSVLINIIAFLVVIVLLFALYHLVLDLGLF